MLLVGILPAPIVEVIMSVALMAFVGGLLGYLAAAILFRLITRR